MLIVFDVDGTLIGGEETDWRSFDDAVSEVTGIALTDLFWQNIQEVTAQAIVHQLLPPALTPHRDAIESAVRAGYLQRLRAAHASNPTVFPTVPGAIKLLQELRCRSDTKIAIATGDWQETSTFKLAAAGLDMTGIPKATSSDCYARADIVRLAVQRSNSSLADAIYVGDGLWDWRTTQQLGIPFIGVGHRRDRLHTAGARHVLPDLEPTAFFRKLTALGAA